jgi:hypothetical protein
MTTFINFGRQGTEKRDTGYNIELRARTEQCFAIDEEDGWRLWFWFPGRSYSATAHWWVNEAGPDLIGDWVAPSDTYGHRLHEQMMQDPWTPCVFADGDSNSSMVLHQDFRASLIPRFAVGIAEASECGRVKIGDDLLGEAIWHRLEPSELAAKWLISELVADINRPEEFLSRLLRVYRTAEKVGWVAAWLYLYLPYLAQKHDGLSGTCA